MTCREVDEMADLEHPDARQHLHRCAACRQAALADAALVVLVKETYSAGDQVPLPEGFVRALVARQREEISRVPRLVGAWWQRVPGNRGH